MLKHKHVLSKPPGTIGRHMHALIRSIGFSDSLGIKPNHEHIVINEFKRIPTSWTMKYTFSEVEQTLLFLQRFHVIHDNGPLIVIASSDGLYIALNKVFV